MQFDRVANVTVWQPGGQGVLIDTDAQKNALRVSFSIEKTSVPHPNKCVAKIYNLSPDRRKLVEAPNNSVILRAGYAQEQGAQTIFTGTVVRSLTVWEGPDWITELEMHDGLLNFRDSKMSASFARGASGLAVVAYFARQFNLPVLPMPAGITDKIYPSGMAFAGRVRDGMAKACQYLGLEWSIQNGNVQIIPIGGTLGTKVAVYLSSQTGLLGSPEREQKTMSDKAAANRGYEAAEEYQISSQSASGKLQQKIEVLGYKVISRLQPIAVPGGYVQVESAGIDNQFFRIEKLAHVGDTHGTDWETRMTLRFT